MIATFNLAPLVYSVWLRWHRLEFGHAASVSPEDGNAHEPSGGPALSKVLRSIRVPRNAIVLDLGVGRGIAALTLSRYFQKVIGIDLSPEMILSAKRNIAKMRLTNIDLHCADARHFSEGIDAVTHVYMFNPFPKAVMTAAMENLTQSLRRAPRELTIIYKFPTCHDAIVAAGFVYQREVRIRFSHPFAIYVIPADADHHATYPSGRLRA